MREKQVRLAPPTMLVVGVVVELSLSIARVKMGGKWVVR